MGESWGGDKVRGIGENTLEGATYFLFFYGVFKIRKPLE
jgi:hypothetical protein